MLLIFSFDHFINQLKLIFLLVNLYLLKHLIVEFHLSFYLNHLLLIIMLKMCSNYENLFMFIEQLLFYLFKQSRDLYFLLLIQN
jgi:hypothetical protein